jgi:glycosyltransferase involved in cell wall biosynthesis
VTLEAMNILQIVPSFYPAFVYGGPIHSVHGLARALVDQGCNVRVLTTDACGRDRTLEVDTRREVDVDGMGVRYCHRLVPHAFAPVLLRELAPMMRWANVVHLNAVYSFPTVPALSVARVLDKPLVWSPRGALQRWEGSRRVVMKDVYDRCCRAVLPRRSAFLATSDDEAVASRGRYAGTPAYIVPNGIEIPPADGEVVRPRHPTSLLFIGRLDPIKAIDQLIRACALLRAETSIAFHLTIAGDGAAEYRTSLQRLVDDLGLASAVTFIGHADAATKKSAFRSADVLVLPSHKENFAVVVAEALAHGVPVIASKHTPWAELETRGCGLWVGNEPRSLAAAVRRVVDMPLTTMGQRGRAWMIERFSWTGVARRVLQVYRDVSAQ